MKATIQTPESEKVEFENSTLAIFDGQSVEWDGMGRDIYENYQAAQKVFKQSSDVMGIDMARVCFGSLSYLQKDTRVGQPAIATVSLAEYRAWQDETEERPDAVTGLSLGLWTAVGASGAIEPSGPESDAKTIELIARRSEIIHKVAERHPGAMAAIIGLAHDHIPELLSETKAELGVLRSKLTKRLAVTGSHKAIKAAKKFAEANGARFEHLSVPFAAHSKRQEGTIEPIMELLGEAPINDPEIKILSNSGEYLTNRLAIVHHLVEQMTTTADWSATQERAAVDGLRRVIGFGPDPKKGLQRQMIKEHKAIPVGWSPNGQRA
jgi:[acyl-carrier-protein] S-malonyltransferase